MKIVLLTAPSQALLKSPEADLKIELDGNDLGAGVFLLALALRFCEARR